MSLFNHTKEDLLMFKWTGFLILSFVVLLSGIALAYITSKRSLKKHIFFNSFHVFIAFSFFSLSVLFLPVFLEVQKEKDLNWLIAAFVSLQSTLQVFSINADFEIIRQALMGDMSLGAEIYSLFASFLYVLSPLLTFGFVLSCFQSITSYRKYFRGYSRHAYIFSELNEKSYALAEHKYRMSGKKILIVFLNVSVSDNKPSAELIEKAHLLDSVFFKKDILSVQFRYHSTQSNLDFFIIGSSESNNIKEALEIKNRYSRRVNTNLFIFSSSKESELLLRGDNEKMCIRRINESRSLVYTTLFEHGITIFENAIESMGKKTITAAIIGLGDSGIEMLKALIWLSQIDGYALKILAFDKKNDVEAALKMDCPELLDDNHNKALIPGDAQYDISFYSVDVTYVDFAETLRNSDPSYIYISLGNDELNIETAITVRTLLKREGQLPVIHALINDTNKQKASLKIKTDNNEQYMIEFIGKIATVFSEGLTIDSFLVKKALDLYSKKNNSEVTGFWESEFIASYYMSVIIHDEICQRLNAKRPEKTIDQSIRNETLSSLIEKHKHRNAFLRSEGWVYSGNLDQSTYSETAKTHHLLIPYEQLTKDAMFI